MPVRHGGTDDHSNLQPACAECNRKKSDGYDIRKCRQCAQNYPGVAEWLEANVDVPDWNDVRVVANSVTYGGPRVVVGKLAGRERWIPLSKMTS